MSWWIRLNVDFDDTPWLFCLSPASQLAWVKLLCHVRKEASRGQCKALAPMVAARKWAVGEEDVVKMLQAATSGGALESDGETWTVTAWAKYQEVDKTNYERQKRYREAKRSVTVCNGVTNVVPVARQEQEQEQEQVIDKSITTPLPPLGEPRDPSQNDWFLSTDPVPEPEAIARRMARAASLCRLKNGKPPGFDPIPREHWENLGRELAHKLPPADEYGPDELFLLLAAFEEYIESRVKSPYKNPCRALRDWARKREPDWANLKRTRATKKPTTDRIDDSGMGIMASWQ